MIRSAILHRKYEQMKRLKLSDLLRGHQAVSKSGHRADCPYPSFVRTTLYTQCRSLAQVRSDRELFPEIWFTSTSPPRRYPQDQGSTPSSQPPDGRTLKLGTTIRALQSCLPTLLASPLPPEILSPHITLHLFPSTHPHLPTVSGRVAYHAALWTAPIAFGRVPILGNVKLIILSERMVKNGPSYTSQAAGNERLIVRWKTCGKTKGGDVRDDEEFCGLFIFEFDEEGRVLSHTIEHAEEGGSWDKVGRVVSVTDWLLGKFGGRKEKELGLAWGCVEDGDGRRRFRMRRDL
ncbi:ras-related protein [Physcia stellaris]|nr:ras-related protein [Physcia stellaris]